MPSHTSKSSSAKNDHQHGLYEHALNELNAALTFGIEPSLEGVTQLTKKLGYPQNDFASIQVAGTNGKSSTTRFIAALLNAEGLTTGLYTSPHLVRYPERIEIDGVVVDDDSFAQAVHDTYKLGQTLSQPPTEFELLTAATLEIFSRKNVDAAVLEVGLGGRWDATSVVSPRTSVVTGVGLDHTKILGDTLEEIALEKAWIIQPGKTVILGPATQAPDSVLRVFANMARQREAQAFLIQEMSHPLKTPGEFTVERRPQYIGDELQVTVEGIYNQYPGLTLFSPVYQARNVATAILAAEAFLGRALNLANVQRAVSTTHIPGRFSVLSKDPLLLVDASHNPQSVREFALSLEGMLAKHEDKPVLLLAVLDDKDARGIVDNIGPLFSDIYVTQTASPRALSASSLASVVEEQLGRKPSGLFSSVEEALQVLANEDVVACGSITLAGEIYNIH